VRERFFKEAFRLGTSRRSRRFAAAMRDPQRAQERARRRLVRLAARTEYGRRQGLTGGESYAEFAAKVPIVDYEDLRPWIERQVTEGGRVVTAEPVVVFEKTSGSSGRSKLIPYTQALLDSFNGCFVLWAHDLIRHGPPFRSGKLFFSVSPPFQDERGTANGVPVSLEDDTAYLSPAMQRLFGSLFVVPPGIKRLRDPHTYRLALACFLIAEPRLEVLSVWSPTYLLRLLQFVAENRRAVVRQLRLGAVGPGWSPLRFAPPPAQRLALLEGDPIPWERVWPVLKLLSCWTDAGSGRFVDALRRAFPSVMIQGKGLLATEAPVTIPLVGAPAPVPLVDDVFLEFEHGEGVRRLHELEEGQQYGVIVTQAGGLMRYRMHDLVRAEGRVGRTPCLRFMGRDNLVADLVGEKLNETFAREALTTAFSGEEGMSFLVPVSRVDAASFYVCVTDSAEAGREPAVCAARLDAELQRAFHYRQARLLGQLGPLQVRFAPDARERYERLFVRRGMKWGDIKYAAVVATHAADELDVVPYERSSPAG
jgi:hypothetical protein